MIKNYLKIAARTLFRSKSYSLLNILGLVVGISFSCMLYVYVSHEFSYDTFHSKSDQIYRVVMTDQRDPQQVRRYGVTVPPLGPELLSQYPEVQDMVRLHRFVGQVIFTVNGQRFQERNWYTTEVNFFHVFDFPFANGDPSTALKEPNSLVMTESAAKKYFGGKDPVGEMIETSIGQVTVTGVVKDIPANSHLKFDLLFSDPGANDRWQNYLGSWGDFGAYTYVVLKDKGAIDELRAKMPALQAEKFARFDGDMSTDFQPITDIYLGSQDIEEGTESTHGQLSYIYIFSTMGIFLLLVACINYINLATSKAMVRSREVGVRKVVGARRGQLIVQFLSESLLITFISAIISIFAMDLFFPYFNQITGKTFDITTNNIMEYIPALAMIALVIGLISGSYPALYLAGLKPVSSLRGRQDNTGGAAGLRKVLVTFQFVITIVMIVSTLVIGRQLNFIQTKDIGFDKDRLMVIDINSGDVRQQFQAMKNEYAAIPGVEHVAVSTRVPGEWKNIPELYVRTSGPDGMGVDSVKTYFMGFDEDMLATYHLTLASGRYFSPAINDSTNILLNESAVKALSLQNPVGARVMIDIGEGFVATTVIGVLKDFNFQSLHQKVAPIVIGAWNSPFQYIDYFNLKVSGDSKSLIDAVTRVHEKFDHRGPIEYHFLDQQLESFYVAENRASLIFRMGGALSVLVASLGLFGLANYNIQRRTKELGIRKVLGASGFNLFMMLSSSYAKQVGIAFLIAAPLAWYATNEWLNAFEYRVPLRAGLFLLAGLIALMIALVTISYRTIRAVRVNPVNSLRQE